MYAFASPDSFRCIQPGWALLPGEVVFDFLPDSQQLEEAFPGYAHAKAWRELREKRDGLLLATDRTQLDDADASLKAPYAIYRQALRDLPQQTSDPKNPVWPVAPGREG